MSEYYEESKETHDVMQNDINDLKNRCGALENNCRAMDQKVISVSSSIEQLKSSIDNVMNTLSKMPQPTSAEDSSNNANMGSQRMEINLGNMVGKPLRRAAISTVGVMLTASEKTAQRVYGLRKGIEEIIGEAQQRNNERRMSPKEQN